MNSELPLYHLSTECLLLVLHLLYIYMYIYIDVKVLIPPESVFVEPNENATMTCAIRGSYVPLKNPWSDPKGELKGLDIKISRIPPATTSGVIVWIAQFNNVSNRLDTKYTFQVPGIEPLEVSILQKNPTSKWKSS